MNMNVNEANIKIKRKWTDQYPEVNINPDAVMRNKIVRFIGDHDNKRCTKTEINEYFSRLEEDDELGKSPNPKYIYQNPHLFKITDIFGVKHIKLTPIGVRVYNHLTSRINENLSHVLIDFDEFTEVVGELIEADVPIEKTYKVKGISFDNFGVEFDKESSLKEIENYCNIICDATSDRVKTAKIEKNKVVFFPNRISSSSKEENIDRIGGISFHPPIFNDSQAPGSESTTSISESTTSFGESPNIFKQLYGVQEFQFPNWKEIGFINIKKALPKVGRNDWWLSTEVIFENINKFEYDKIKSEIIKSTKSNSEYKIDSEYIYRKSDHWGNVASCNWLCKVNGVLKNNYNGCAKAKLSDFIRLDNSVVLTYDIINKNEAAKKWTDEYIKIAKKSTNINENENENAIKKMFKLISDFNPKFEITPEFEVAVSNKEIETLSKIINKNIIETENILEKSFNMFNVYVDYHNSVNKKDIIDILNKYNKENKSNFELYKIIPSNDRKLMTYRIISDIEIDEKEIGGKIGIEILKIKKKKK